jgi:hypothetical protein
MKTNAEFKNRLCGQFKNLLAMQAGVLLLCLAAANGSAQIYTNQGEVNFGNLLYTPSRIWTNNVPNGWTPDLSGTNAGTTAGWISGPRGTYMFALFSAPTTVTTVEGGTPWTDANWAFTGNYATNAVPFGRIIGNYNPDNSVTIPGYAPGSSASLVVIGWNTAVGGSTLTSFETAWNQHAAGLYYGCSSVANIQLGNGDSIPDVTIFGASTGQIEGFVMAPVVLNVVLSGSGVVTNCTEANLRAAMTFGGTVTFACDGTINLSETITVAVDSVLDGSGHQVTINGGQAVRLFYVKTNVGFTLIKLTLANGLSTNGGAIFNDGGKLTLQDSMFLANNASGVSGNTLVVPGGGALCNSGGMVNATNCTFSDNCAGWVQVTGIFEGHGGAILNKGGIMNLWNCTFSGNIASGNAYFPPFPQPYSYYAGADGFGGAIYDTGNTTVNGCAFLENLALGSQGSAYPGGSGHGGAIYCAGIMRIDDSTFSGNSSSGASASSTPTGTGVSGGSGSGGAIFNGGSLVVQKCALVRNAAYGAGGSWGFLHPDGLYSYRTGNGGASGSGSGGAIYNSGFLMVESSTVISNTAVGTQGGQGGPGIPPPPLLGPPGETNGGTGAAGGPGGGGYGGGLCNNGTADLINCTLAFNTGTGGGGGQGGTGAYAPFGIGGNGGLGAGGGSGVGVISGAVNMTNCTVDLNFGIAGAGGAGGQGGSGVSQGNPGSTGTAGIAVGGIAYVGTLLINSILANNTPINCFGTITDAGHNLSSDGTCSFTNVGSLNNTDPMLGPLADNGGPTMTMALMPGSPAIDAGDTAAAPSTDQRGYARPVGLAADIGAYECSPPVIAALRPAQTAEDGCIVNLAARITGFPPLTCQWFFNGNAITGCTNRILCLPGVQASNVGAYTLVASNIDGSVTSSPAMLNVIPMVERRPVPAINLMAQPGSSLGLDYCDALDSTADWETMATMTLSNTSQFYFDVSAPLPPHRFYRAWQSGTPSVAPSLSLPGMVPAITLTGDIGSKIRLDYINAIGPTDAWMTLDTVTLTNTSQLYFDVSSISQPRRLYRIVPVP